MHYKLSEPLSVLLLVTVTAILHKIVHNMIGSDLFINTFVHYDYFV